MTGDQYIGNCGRGSSFPLLFYRGYQREQVISDRLERDDGHMGGGARNGADAHQIESELDDALVGDGGCRGDGRGRGRDDGGGCQRASSIERKWIAGLVFTVGVIETWYGFWWRQ